MHDGLYQKAQEASYLYANVAEHLMTLSFNLSVGFQGGSARLTTRTPGLAIFWDFGLHLRLQHASQVAVLLVHDFDKTMNCQPMSCNPLNVKSNTIAILGFISKIEMAHGLTKLPFGTSSPLEMAHGLNKLGF